MAFIQFSTHSFPVNERLDAAQDIYAAMANIDVQTPDNSVPCIETRIRLLPGISISWVKTSRLVVHRRARQMQDGNDDFSLLLNPLGNSTWHAAIERIGDIKCLPGRGCFSFNDRPGTITLQGPQTHLVNINLSRTMFEPLIANLEEPGKSPMLESETFGLLSQCALELVDEHQSSSDVLEQTNRLLDLAALAVGANRDYEVHARQRGLKQARMKAVKADLLIHACRGDLSLDWLARRHGISPGYIRAMFKKEGTSFTDYLLNLRLQKAFDCLCDPACMSKTITDIVYIAGFNNPSWFYRAFKQRFGVSPGDVRTFQQH